MLFKNVAISEKGVNHGYFKIGFGVMLFGLLYAVIYISDKIAIDHNISYLTSFLYSIVVAYAFYRAALSPNGFLNTYLKYWWYFSNGGVKPELKWYDKIMISISIILFMLGLFLILGIAFLLFGAALAVLP